MYFNFLGPQQKHNNDDNENTKDYSSKNDHHKQRQQQQDLQQHVWFTEWSENKIAKLNANGQLLPFSLFYLLCITIKRLESKETRAKR